MKSGLKIRGPTIRLCAMVAGVFLSAIAWGSGEGHVLYVDHFDDADGSLPDRFWTEGSPHAWLEGGRLFMNADPETGEAIPPVSTVWVDREFSGNLKVEFEVCVVSSMGDANNINFFFLYSDPRGRPLRESRGVRESGAYRLYQDLNGYIFTFLANGNPELARFRFRDNPGFHLLDEYNGYNCRAGQVYRVVIRKWENRIQYFVDGRLIFDVVHDEPNDPHHRGYLGFRTWRTKLWWDNLKISRLDEPLEE